MPTGIKNVWTIDFETNNSDEAIENGETFVWLWDLCSIVTYKHHTGRTIEGLFSFLKNNFKSHTIFYSHNLKFDGSFILYYLIKSGYKYSPVEQTKLNSGEFTAIIDARKVYYRISVKVNGVLFEFRDSAKKIPQKVEEIAKSWGLPILKGCIDYKENHTRGEMPTEEEVAYIHNDTEIVARVLNEMYKDGLNKLTASADTLASYKKCIGEDLFDKLFPVLDVEDDDFIRKSYNGGVCYVNPDFKEKELHNVNCYDVNSMYPSVMHDSLLPYGRPKKRYGLPTEEELKIYPLFIINVHVCMRVKEDHFPSIMTKGFGFIFKNEYITDTKNEMIDLTLTNVDLDLMIKHYDIFDIEYGECYMFKGSTNLFKKYIDPIYKIKCESTGAKKQLAKLKLNSLYGKFASNPQRKNIEPYIDENGYLSFKILDVYMVDTIYTALSTFITAYARHKLFTAIELNHRIFVYCDTDSIHTIGDAVGIEIDKSKLGAWDKEKEYELFKVLAQKTYYGVLKNSKKIIKIAGCPENVKQLISYEDFKFGSTFDGKLRPVLVEGGTVLVSTSFTIKER